MAFLSPDALPCAERRRHEDLGCARAHAGCDAGGGDRGSAGDALGKGRHRDQVDRGRHRRELGDGKLTYQGKDHAFTVNGLSVVDVGVSKVSTTGNVYHLKKLSDFAGNYAAAEAGAALGAGKSAVAMRNQNGVAMELTSTATGIQFTPAPKGVAAKVK